MSWDFFDNLFSDPFDFDCSGTRSADEDFMEYMMFNEVMNNSDITSDDIDECEGDDEIY